MSNTSDIINLIRDVLLPIGITIYKLGYKDTAVGTERIQINSIPVNQERAGKMKLNNDVVNVNLYIPKINGLPDAARIQTIDALIQSAFEDYNIKTTRVGYYYLNPRPSTTFNESDLETLTNIRTEVTYT